MLWRTGYGLLVNLLVRTSQIGKHQTMQVQLLRSTMYQLQKTTFIAKLVRVDMYQQMMATFLSIIISRVWATQSQSWIIAKCDDRPFFALGHIASLYFPHRR